MRWAIDKIFERGLVNGWVASDDGNPKDLYCITIRTPEKVIYKNLANSERPDVKAAGLHETGFCGFSFNANLCGVREGDLLFIELISDSGEERVTHSFLYAAKKETQAQFDRFEIPRDDFSIMEQCTSSLLLHYPHLLALKILIIRLRRHKRAKGWRSQFIGVNYDYKESDWNLFYYMVSTFREAIFNSLTVRNLFSITDTIADFSIPIERCAAYALFTFMAHERFSQTLTPLSINKIETIKNNSRQYNIWGGMLTNRLQLDDSLDIFLTRSCDVLASTPLILDFFKKIILEAMSEESSIYSRNINFSDYFSSAWNHYRCQFTASLNAYLRNISIPEDRE